MYKVLEKVFKFFMMIIMTEGIKYEVLNRVPELVEGEQAKQSPRRLASRSEEGGGKRRGALFIPFDKLRDHNKRVLVWPLVVLLD